MEGMEHLEEARRVFTVKTRETARIVLLNEQDRILLFKMKDPSVTSKENPAGEPVWFPPGGGVEENESYLEAAKRELWEETGLADGVNWGPLVWIRDIHLFVHQKETRFIEYYYVARVQGKQISTDHFTEVEKETYQAHHWWSVDEIMNTQELIFPKQLGQKLIPLLKGEYPAEPIAIE
jgi:ADP-ribose pyrophosphatase YjhB (NUDIX family)